MDTIADTETVRIGRLIVGPLDNNVYVVTCTTTNAAVIVDAAAEPDRILSAVEGLDVVAILTTHGHHDHIGAVRRVKNALDIPVRLHQDDIAIAGLEPDVPISNFETIEVGELTLIALHTPGHTPGSICFHVDQHLLTGDTLFPGGPGATRFPYSDFDQIMRSLDERLFVLDDATVVYPGHGATTTLGAERPHLDEWRRRRW